MSKKIIIANWKLNPITESEAVRLAKAVDEKDVVICPPFPFLSAVKKVMKKSRLGSQDSFWDGPPSGSGAYTGEVSAPMLKKLGVQYVILGHSERRRHLGETDEMINKKVLAALKSGLEVILCVGEPAEIRKEGSSAAKTFVSHQLSKNLKGASRAVTVAYEPVWAISTSRDPNLKETPEMILEMADLIKSFFAKNPPVSQSKVIYGGSVTSDNIGRIIHYKDIEGALVGGASLRSVEFKKIIKISKNY